MQKRTKNFLEVGFYLSKFGENLQDIKYALPPDRLKVDKWEAAYRMFYEKLNAGRSVLTFERSLKNARDSFDSHLKKSGREGWKTEDQKPNPLGKDAQIVFNELIDKSEDNVWDLISIYADLDVRQYNQQFSDIISIQESESELKVINLEGGKKIVISSKYERSPSLRKKAKDIHGTKCQICGFDFAAFYGEWGYGFIEVHHIQSLSDNKGKVIETNPKTDLAVICANCHRMVHRKIGKPLSIEDLKNKIVGSRMT